MFMMLSSITDTEPMSKNDCVVNAARYLHNMQILVPQHVNELRLLLLDPLSSTHCTYDTNYSFHTYHKVVPKLFHRRGMVIIEQKIWHALGEIGQVQ
jgi:hypothetical protein